MALGNGHCLSWILDLGTENVVQKAYDYILLGYKKLLVIYCSSKFIFKKSLEVRGKNIYNYRVIVELTKPTKKQKQQQRRQTNMTHTGIYEYYIIIYI